LKHQLNDKNLGNFSSLMSMKGRISSLKIFIFFAVGALFIPWALAQPPKAPQPADQKTGEPLKVALLPVAINSPEDLQYLRQGVYAMFSSRVELPGRVVVMERAAVKKAVAQFPGEIDSETARKIGETLGADFVVFGSLTKLGDSASLDLRVMEVKGGKPASSVYVQARKLEEIIAQMDDLARKVDERILGYSLSPPAEKAVVAEKPAEAPKALAAIPAVPQAVPQAAPQSPLPGFRPMQPGREQYEFWRSQAFPIQIVGMGIADLDGDGRNEVALIDSKNLYIYRWEKDFPLLKKIEGGRLSQNLAVEVGDVRKTGKAEIFVTAMAGQQFVSFVVVYQDGDYKVIARDLEWFFRIIDWGDRGKVLLGQGKGREEGLVWPVYEMVWDGKTYKDSAAAKLPRRLGINGLCTFAYEGKTYFAYIDTDFRLKVMNEKGKVVWSSKDTYGSENSVRVKRMPMATGYQEADDELFVNVRLLSQGNEVFILKNLGLIGEFFKRARSYSKGEVQRFAWTGAMLQETWKSQEISGYMADMQIQGLNRGGEKTLVLAVNLPSESWLGGGKASALMISRLQ
jgi:TolB-like protein